MANDIQLTKLLSISRTTVRACVEHLCEIGIIKRDGPNKLVLRQPNESDFFDIKDKTDLDRSDFPETLKFCMMK